MKSSDLITNTRVQVGLLLTLKHTTMASMVSTSIEKAS